MNTIVTGQEFIEHYGVKGMRWGVRNDRRGRSSGSKTQYKKQATRLSDAELKRRISRMELEKKYSDLKKPAPPAGVNYVKKLLDGAGKQAIGVIIGGAVSFFVQKELKKRFGD